MVLQKSIEKIYIVIKTPQYVYIYIFILVILSRLLQSVHNVTLG